MASSSTEPQYQRASFSGWKEYPLFEPCLINVTPHQAKNFNETLKNSLVSYFAENVTKVNVVTAKFSGMDVMSAKKSFFDSDEGFLECVMFAFFFFTVGFS